MGGSLTSVMYRFNEKLLSSALLIASWFLSRMFAGLCTLSLELFVGDLFVILHVRATFFLQALINVTPFTAKQVSAYTLKCVEIVPGLSEMLQKIETFLQCY